MVDTLQDEIETARQSIRSEAMSMSVGEIVNLYRDEEIVIRPEFQRLFRWDTEQKSRLIESLLLGIPVPSIFVIQRDDSVWEVIDGLQRLSTILEFMGELRDESKKVVVPASVLRATKYLKHLQGAAYDEDTEGATAALSPGQRLALKRAKIDLKILLPESDEKAKFELFDRLNTGGSPLSAQEIRNAQLIMLDPSLFEWLDGLRNDENFQDTISITDRLYDEAKDMELVCRFIALIRTSDEDLKNMGNIDSFVSNKIFATVDENDFDRQFEGERFRKIFEVLNAALGDDAFRRFADTRFLGGFSVSAYETITVGVGLNLDRWLETADKPELLRSRVAEWWGNSTFRNASKGGSRGSTRVPKTLPEARDFFSSVT
ncbi:DUF262 domain-containing protein [Mycobacterium sherrisii]|uniref:DUF262 domain-containing protein n=1 Tax=Mycobacterium sherrisii TaxID=243061 RepID=UPI000A158A9C|nr:DUF262 domain-containing protein [Mycobacterium sherrisii]MCV7031868.1 DUF262 domain-containing protein [Mycobacterium sherrisii]ORW86303.1 hypothetical protein AWC25_22670 [Mycobacterium sherrisii]